MYQISWGMGNRFAGPSDEEVEKVTVDMRKEIERAMGAARCTLPSDSVVSYVASLCASLVLHGFGSAGPAHKENWEQVCFGSVFGKREPHNVNKPKIVLS